MKRAAEGDAASLAVRRIRLRSWAKRPAPVRRAINTLEQARFAGFNRLALSACAAQRHVMLKV